MADEIILSCQYKYYSTPPAPGVFTGRVTAQFEASSLNPPKPEVWDAVVKGCNTLKVAITPAAVSKPSVAAEPVWHKTLPLPPAIIDDRSSFMRLLDDLDALESQYRRN